MRTQIRFYLLFQLAEIIERYPYSFQYSFVSFSLPRIIQKIVLKSIRHFHVIYLTKLKCQLVVLKSKLWAQFMVYLCIQEFQILQTFKHYLPFFPQLLGVAIATWMTYDLFKMRPVCIIFLFPPSWYRVSLSSLMSLVNNMLVYHTWIFRFLLSTS